MGAKGWLEGTDRKKKKNHHTYKRDLCIDLLETTMNEPFGWRGALMRSGFFILLPATLITTLVVGGVSRHGEHGHGGHRRAFDPHCPPRLVSAVRSFPFESRCFFFFFFGCQQKKKKKPLSLSLSLSRRRREPVATHANTKTDTYSHGRDEKTKASSTTTRAMTRPTIGFVYEALAAFVSYDELAASCLDGYRYEYPGIIIK